MNLPALGSVELRARWPLDPSIRFLNNGSFGATPHCVLQAVRELHLEIEAEPVRFFARELPGRLAVARERVATFVGAEPAGLAFVPNASAGVNAVLRSYPWKPGDGLILADQTYNAVKQTAHWVAQRYGVELQWVTLPFPVEHQEQLHDPWLAAVRPNTRMAIVDHVSSPTALILPVESIVPALQKHGVAVLVDGAHAPGLLPLSLRTLGAEWYVGNLHKWAYAAKGAAILVVREDQRAGLSPTVISHGYGQGLLAEFDWTGTVDPSPYLTAPLALDFLEALGPVRAYTHALVQDARLHIAEALGTPLPHPDNPALYGPMAAMLWPDPSTGDFAQVMELNRRLYDDHRIEVPFMAYDRRIWLRISAQAFNTAKDYAALVAVLASGWR